MEPAHIDFETTSPLDLNEVGVYRYVEHPDTRILCMSWFLPERFQIMRTHVWYPGQPFPELLRGHVLANGGLIAWNDGFERTVWREIGVKRHGFPVASQVQWHNVQAIAMQNNLPASLDGSAKAMGLPERKDAEGKRLMMRMAVGKDITPENLQRLGVYCEQDVRTEVGADHALGRKWLGKERKVYLLSEQVNDRGILIDREFVTLAAKAVADYQAHTAQEMKARFGIKPTEVQQVRAFCADRRVVLDDMRADTVESVLAAPEFYPDDVVEILAMRQKAAGNSPKKFAAMLRAVCSDGRIRGMFSYFGASQTGRWSGRIVQPQNLPRPTMSYEDTLAAMDALRAARGRWEALGADPLGVLLNCIRPSLIPGPAGVFTVGDEAAIEARVIAWLAGCPGPLAVFEQPGGDIYLHAAESIYHRPVTKEDKPERQIGKVATLALGFGGGVHAFTTMGRGYGVHVPEKEAEEIKVAWRKAHPEIVTLWAVLDSMALKACVDAKAVAPRKLDYAPDASKAAEIAASVEGLGCVKAVRARLEKLRVKFEYRDRKLLAWLPSGRWIAYHGAYAEYAVAKALKEIVEKNARPGEIIDPAVYTRWRVRFFAPVGASMVPEGTYGGRLSENLTQAIARDVLAEAMLRVPDLPIVLHAHDEIVAEGDHVERLNKALTERLDWAKDLPLAAEVKLHERYWK